LLTQKGTPPSSYAHHDPQLSVITHQRIEGTGKLDDERLNLTFRLFWPDLESAIKQATISLSAPAPAPAKRSPDDLLTEVLQRVRSLERFVAEENRAKLEENRTHLDEVRRQLDEVQVKYAAVLTELETRGMAETIRRDREELLRRPERPDLSNVSISELLEIANKVVKKTE
jgi:hypothetical protein